MRHEETERAAIGAILLTEDNAALHSVVAEGLEPEHFCNPAFRMIAEMATELSAQGKAVDVISVEAALESAGKLDAVGGHDFLWGLLDGPMGVSHAQTYARILVEDARLRSVQAAAESAAVAITGGADIGTVRTSLEEALQRTLPESDAESGPIGTLLRRGVGLEKANVHSWGLETLDKRTGGLPEGCLVVIGAYPGTGKTSLTTQVLCSLARMGTPVTFFSAEMSAAQVLSTLIGRESRIGASKLRALGSKGLVGDDLARAGDASAELAGLPFHLVARRLSASEIAGHARHHIRKHGVKVMAVDYLQLLRCEAHEENRRIGIDASVNTLKALAQSTGLTVILLSQLARGSAQNPQPASSLLKESGGIMEAADVVLILNRPHFREANPCPACGTQRGLQCDECRGTGQVSLDTEIILSIEKNRFGGVGSVTLGWNGRLMKVFEKEVRL